VIDGQQRLTSLYIGLCGTYAYKQPRVWWPSAQDDRILPPRKLYVDLTAPLNSDDELMMKYNFRFLTDKQYTDSLTDNKHHWFCLHEIFKYEQYDSLMIFYLTLSYQNSKKEDSFPVNFPEKLCLNFIPR
jgi:uncharacterized protein with ParB-like and HNH nuclease domain